MKPIDHAAPAVQDSRYDATPGNYADHPLPEKSYADRNLTNTPTTPPPSSNKPN
jgi:hypothetical protein